MRLGITRRVLEDYDSIGAMRQSLIDFSTHLDPNLTSRFQKSSFYETSLFPHLRMPIFRKKSKDKLLVEEKDMQSARTTTSKFHWNEEIIIVFDPLRRKFYQDSISNIEGKGENLVPLKHSKRTT